MGEVFAGRYELLDLIGQGAMGSVWRAHDRKSDEVVAAKVLRQSDAASLLRFVRETAFRVQHPHVVTPLGWAGEDDRVLFTMPVVDGGSVSTLVGDHGPLPPRFVAEVLRQVLDALRAVHSSGIVHRDIKPANILLAATGAGRPHAYLTDFGIAVEIGGPRLTETNLVIGTPGYIAPEQQRGEVTTASDLFALGVLGEFMLTAQLEGHAPATERPADVPEVLWSLLVDLRAEAPDDRPDASAALARLQVHDLAWTPDAVGDVEVLRQVGAPGEIDAELTTMTALRDEPGAEPGAGVEAPPAAGAKRSSRVPLLLGGFGVLAVVAFVGVLLLWSPWTGEEPHQPPSATTSSTSEPSDEDPATSEATDETPTEEDPTSSTTSPTSGSVSVGTVVTRVGQECQYSDVGLRETTSDGTDVVCRLGDDGDYTWERDES